MRLPGFIDEPGLYGPVEPWMRHLTMLRHLPDDTACKQQMIEEARRVIMQLRGGEDNVIPFSRHPVRSS